MARGGRLNLRSVAALAIGVTAARVAAAAPGAAWPTTKPPPLPAGWRGPGGGLAIVPLACWWACIVGWLRTVDWLYRDATKHGVAPAFWSTACGLPLPLAALLAWWIPSPLAGITLMVLAWLVPVSCYAVVRNRTVPASDRVLTPAHGRRVLNRLLSPLGIEIPEPVNEDESLPKVDLAAAGGRNDAENESRLAAAKGLPGAEEFRRQMLAAVVARAATIVFDVAAETTVRHEVDGVWEKPRVRQPPRNRREKEAWVEVPPSSRDVGEAVVAAAAALCGLPAGAATGSGRFAVRVDGKPRNARLTLRSEGKARQLIIQLESSEATFKRLGDLGIPEGIVTSLGELVSAERGLLLVSAPAGGGLTTTFDLVVESADRLLRDFISIDDAARPPREIQNVKPVRFDARTGVTPLAALADALREYPSAIVARDVRDKELVVELVRLAVEGKFVVMSVRATDAVEAVTRVLSCGVEPRQLGGTLLGALSQRLVRRLCPKCREETPPPPQLLAKLKLAAEQLPAIRKRSEQGCRLCQGSGYLGRVGVFELATGGTLRRTVAEGGGAAQIGQAAVKDGMNPLREAALQLVVTGATSLDEWQRVFVSKAQAGEPAPAAAAAPPRDTPAPAASTSGATDPPQVRRRPPPGAPPARRSP